MDPRLPLGSAADFVSGQRILSRVIVSLPSLTKRYKPVFMRLVVVKVSLRLASYQHVAPRDRSLSLRIGWHSEIGFIPPSDNIPGSCVVLHTLFRALRKPTII